MDAGNGDTDEEVNWLDCVSAIETDKGVVYFCNIEYFSQDGGTSTPDSEQGTSFDFRRAELKLERIINEFGDNDTCHHQQHDGMDDTKERVVDNVVMKPLLTPVADFVSRFHQGHGCFMYSITAYNPLDTQQDTVQNCLSNQLLLADLRETFPDCDIFKNFSYFPGRPHHFERGFTVVLPLAYPKDHEGILHNLALKYRQAAYFKCRILADGRSTQTIVLLEEYVKEVQESLVVVERLGYHPAYLTRTNNNVFHGFRDAMNILSKCDYLPEAGQLMAIAQHQLAVLPACLHGNQTKLNHPVIVMEGTCDAGISNHSLRLSKAIGGTHLKSPPSCIQHLRETFDKQNKLIQAAFYTVCNYILGSQTEEARKHTPVVLDRFWNSTAAFSITSDVGRGVSNLPPKDHFVYDWPMDLFKPDAVILVGSKKAIRNQSRSRKSRGERITKQLMFETLLRMKTSSWIEVDRIRDQCHSDEAVTMVTIDKLHSKKIGNFRVGAKEDGICPGTTLHPTQEHDILPVGGLESLTEDSVLEDIGFL